MKVLQQRHNECLLYTISALSGVDIDKVRKRACSIAGFPEYSWSHYVQMRSTTACKFMNNVVDQLLREFNLPHDLDYRMNNVQENAQDLSGRGAIVVDFIDKNTNNREWGHITPYEDNVIYDVGGIDGRSMRKPDCPVEKGESLTEYLTRLENLNPGFSVKVVKISKL